MRIFIVVGIVGALLAGCASQPPVASDPKKDANTVALVGMILMASAAQDKDSAAHKLWQVKIPPAAFEVISEIKNHQRKLGKWPTKDEIAVPSGVKNIVVSASESGLDVTINSESAVLLVCRITQDGTVLIAPPFLRATSGTNQWQRTPR